MIVYRVRELSKVKSLTPTLRNILESELQRATHRTYLWVYLVFDYLKAKKIKKTLDGIKLGFKTLPKGVNEAYEKILSKSTNDLMARKALTIVLAASRPLTLGELNIAMNMNEDVKSFRDLDLEDEGSFQESLRSWCGLFLLVHHGKVYFLH